MGFRRVNRVLGFLVLLSIVSLATFGAGASLVETTTGSLINGTITGIAPLLRLDSSPEASFDIPLSTVSQMVIDFPRVVVETPTRVYIGPYSDFSGIDDLITVQQKGSTRDIPFASLRGIAFNGHSFQKIPRLWLSGGFLTLPAVLNISAAPSHGQTFVAAPTPEKKTTSPQTWDELYHATTPPKQASTPWWLLLLITAGLGVLVYLSL